MRRKSASVCGRMPKMPSFNPGLRSRSLFIQCAQQWMGVYMHHALAADVQNSTVDGKTVAKSERRRLRAQLQYRHFFVTSFRRGACFPPATYAPHSMRHRFSFEWGAKSFFVAKTEGAIVTNVGVFLRLPALKYASSTSLFCNCARVPRKQNVICLNFLK